MSHLTLVVSNDEDPDEEPPDEVDGFEFAIGCLFVTVVFVGFWSVVGYVIYRMLR